MADKKRESMASKIDEVARNQIWREHLKKEYEAESALTPFQLNPKTRVLTSGRRFRSMCARGLWVVTVFSTFGCGLAVSAITQKPTLTHPADFGKMEVDKETEALGTHPSETDRPLRSCRH